MTSAGESGAPPRLAELLGALASAADLANGFPLGKVLRTATLAVVVARRAGLDEATAATGYWVSVLRYLGCTAFSHEEAHLYGAGDDLAVRHTMSMADASDKLGTLGAIVRGIAPGAPWRAKAAAIARLLGSDAVTGHAHAQCNAAVLLGRQIGFEPAVLAPLDAITERWDGLGAPRGLAGEALPLASRLHHLADVAEIAHHRGGLDGLRAVLAKRRGKQLDPRLCDAALADVPGLARALATATSWEDFLAAEPGPVREVADADAVARALGFFADLKSVYLLGHSQRVAELAGRTALGLGLDAEARAVLVRAGHLHDLGRVAIATGTWDRKGPLGVLEWEEVRRHTYYTDRVLALSPALATVRAVASFAHERGRGDGYHRGLDGSRLGAAARVLGVCDAIVALGEARPHRAARSAEAVRDQIHADVAAGGYDARIADAALAAAGIESARRGTSGAPCGLSERELEVLGWVARGKTNKEIAIVLGLSPKTVQHHVAHIYEKIGVYSRAGAAIFAMEQRLI